MRRGGEGGSGGVNGLSVNERDIHIGTTNIIVMVLIENTNSSNYISFGIAERFSFSSITDITRQPGN